MSATILIVDDSTSMRQALRFTLEQAQYRVIEAADGADGLAKLNASVKMVITDLNMPVMTGIELIRSIRAKAEYKGLPLVMLTTESMSARKEEGRAAGASGWIVKPFQAQQLLAVVKRLVP